MRQVKKENESISLDEWVYSHYDMDEMKSIFLNMDRALKYIHDHGYCVEVFYPLDIYVLNQEDDYVLFNKLMKMPDDEKVRRRLIEEDIFTSTLLQIGFYSIQNKDFLYQIRYLKPEFLKEHFDEFVQFLPQDVVPYYRGVVMRGANVYLCEYSLEKRNRDLEELERQMGEESNTNKQFVKENVNLTNDAINNIIYSQINGMRDRAFINMLMVPTILLGVMLLFGALSWIFSLLS